MKGNFGKLATIFIPLIVAVWALIPTYESSKFEEDLAKVEKRANEAASPADSLEIIQSWKRQNGEAFDKAKQNKLKLGLDLRGGMYVTLEVDVVKLLEESAQNAAIDDIFNQVIDKTREEVKVSEEPTLDIFLKHFDDIASKEGKSLISYFDVGDVRDASEEKIIQKLETDISSAIDQAQEVIRQRIDKYGVAEPNIQKQGSRRILLELPGVTNEEEMRQLLSTTARLEFNLVKNNEIMVNSFAKIDELLASQQNRNNTAVTGDDLVVNAESDSSSTDSVETNPNDPYAGLEENEAQAKYKSDHPFTTLFSTFFVPSPNAQYQQYAYVSAAPKGRYYFEILNDSLPKFNEIMARPEVQALLPFDYKIAYSAKPTDRTLEGGVNIKTSVIYSLKAEPELIGDVIVDARKDMDQTTNSWVVSMRMNTEGAEKWARITGANVNKQIAIVLDGSVYSAPNVIQKITGGSSQISGMANIQEASLLEIVLKAGALKAPVRIIEENVVGASLGEDSIEKGISSSLWAFGLIFIFMFFYYMRGGLVADIALFINIALILTILISLKGTLTLPGIAGIILTMGMAVDANILIFERIREELLKGRSLKSAIEEGYKNARSAIFDSNITTLITGFILFSFGSGMIKGFALTLIYGILSTLFTAIVVTKAIISLSVGSGATTFSFGQPKNES